MMNKKIWSTLFSIQILDKTKKAGDAWDVALVPTEACVQKMKRLNLFFKKIQNGGVIIAENDGVKKPLKDTKAESFTFYLKSLNRLLENKLPISKMIPEASMPFKINGASLFYFDNLDKNGKILRGGTSPIYQKEDRLTDADRALLVGTNSTILFKEDLNLTVSKRAIEGDAEKKLSDLVGLKDKDKPLNFNKLVKDTQTDMFINVPDALYTVSWGNTLAERVNVFKSDALIAEKPFAIVEIFENKDILLNKATHYTLEIIRKAIWRYMIFKDETALNTDVEFIVESGSSKLVFDKFDKNSPKTDDTQLEIGLIERFEAQRDMPATLYKSREALLIDRKTPIKARLEWMIEDKIKKEELTIPTSESSEAILTYIFKL